MFQSETRIRGLAVRGVGAQKKEQSEMHGRNMVRDFFFIISFIVNKYF